MLLAGISATAAGDFLPRGLGIRNPFDSCTRKSSFVLLAGIEPASPPSEGGILSIERQERMRSDAKIYFHVLRVSFCKTCLQERTRVTFGRAAGSRTRSTCTPCMCTAAILRPEANVLCRGAENRTRSLRTRSVCTTGILRPDREHSCKTSYRKNCGWT